MNSKPTKIEDATECQNHEPASGFHVEVFYDGACPLCRREIALLSKWDTRNRIAFTDISATGFRPESLGIAYDDLMAEIHGRLPNGEVIRGVEVFRRLYAAVGLSWVVVCTRLPGISHILDWGYDLFAKNRLRLTGRCTDETCQI